MPFYWSDTDYQVGYGVVLTPEDADLGSFRVGCQCRRCYNAVTGSDWSESFENDNGLYAYYNYDQNDYELAWSGPREAAHTVARGNPDAVVEGRTYSADAEAMRRLREESRDPRLNWSYKPPWHMNGEGPLYYGLELEIETNSRALMHKVAASVKPLAFLKRDSSVAGFELVTHPMSYAWAMENFPWSLLPDLAAEGCSVRPANNGIHVHVSRAGFRGAAHQYRWLKMLYRNQDQVNRLARRNSAQWSPFRTRDQQAQYAHILSRKADEKIRFTEDEYHRLANAGNLKPSDEVRLNAEIMEARNRYSMLRRGDATLRDRHMAVNTAPRDTLELRVFAGTLNELEAKAALQFADATVGYTRQLTSGQVSSGEGWKWPAFSKWLREHEGLYPELVRANDYAKASSRATARYDMARTARKDTR